MSSQLFVTTFCFKTGFVATLALQLCAGLSAYLSRGSRQRHLLAAPAMGFSSSMGVLEHELTCVVLISNNEI